MSSRKCTPRLPSYRHHKPTDQAFVELNGKRHYLGKFGTRPSRTEYRRMIAEWEARGRQPLVAPTDLTALHLAIQKKTGLVTFHSPNPMWGLGSEGNLQPFAATYFWRALLRREYVGADGHPLSTGYPIIVPEDAPQIEMLRPGIARGRLTGGNLSLVIALMGTEYEIETTDRILFLEDVDERPYRIDRYLSQLRLAGKFDHLAGVILGQFRGCEPNEGEASLTLAEVFADYFGGLDVPVVTNFPAGHTACNATLPLGAMVEVDADHRQIRVLENPARID